MKSHRKNEVAFVAEEIVIQERAISNHFFGGSFKR